MSEADQRAIAFGRRCVLAAAVLWSISGVLAKTIDLPPVAIAFYRSFFAGLALLPFTPTRNWVFRPAMILSAPAFAGMIGAYLFAIKTTTAANAIFLQCSATFWLVPASALILRERPDRRALLGIGIAGIGITAIVAFGYDGRPGEGWGVGLALLSGIMYAVVVLTLRGLRRLDPIWLSAVNNLGGALVLGAGTLAAGMTIPWPSSRDLLILLVFAVIQMAIPYALFARGLRELDAADAGLIGLLEPVLNPIWVALILHEYPAPATQIGGAFLLAGVAVRYLPRRDSRQGPPPENADGPAPAVRPAESDPS